MFCILYNVHSHKTELGNLIDHLNAVCTRSRCHVSRHHADGVDLFVTQGAAPRLSSHLCFLPFLEFLHSSKPHGALGLESGRDLLLYK